MAVTGDNHHKQSIKSVADLTQHQKAAGVVMHTQDSRDYILYKRTSNP